MTEETKKISAEIGEEQPATESAPLENQAPWETELANLRQQLEAKDQEAKNSYDRYVRQLAEAENFKKRNARERDDAIRFANEALLKELLPIIDNLERAIAHAAGGSSGNSLVEGVEMVLKGFLDILSKFGVCQISAIGQPFDPAKHEAMAQVESDQCEPNVVIDELHKGYMFRDRLLRPTLVSVAKAPETKGKKNDIDQVENNPSDD
ncbi:MAG: heat shock protein GrpE [Deltaproteobacteria bacterium]|nr:heat shock protein GrpE [Deltaproteobacteria bacterium]